MDRRRWRLERGGEQISAQPRVLEVLAYLAERSGRLVTKEELFAAVWGGAEVGDAALARCISDARKALGDSARSPRYLKTVHGQGFRFLETVDVGEEPLPALATELKADEKEPRVGFRAWVWGLLGVAGAGMLWWFLSPPGDSLVLSKPQPAVRIAIASFSEGKAGIQGPQQAPVIEMLLADMILDEPSLVLRPGESVVPTAVDGALPEAAGSRDLDVLLTGRLSLGDGGAAPSIELESLDFRGGSEPRLTRASPLPLPSTLRDSDIPTLAESLQERLEEILRDLGIDSSRLGPPLLPRRLETLRLRRLSQRWMAQGTCQLEPVLEVLEAAKGLDSEYAPVRLEMARAHLYLTSACGLHPRHGDEALRSVERALDAAPAWPRARKLQGRILAFQGRLKDAVKVLGGVVAERPADPEARCLLAAAMAQAGRLEGAGEQLHRTLASDPGYFRASGEAPLPLLESGQEERFLSLLPPPSDPRLAFLRGLALARLGRREEAIEILTPALELQPDHLFGRISAALAATLEGSPREAAEVLHQLVREQSSPMTGGAMINLRLAQVAARADLPELAVEQLGLAVEKGFSCGQCLRLDPFFDGVRSRQEFQRLMDLADGRQAQIAAWVGG